MLSEDALKGPPFGNSAQTSHSNAVYQAPLSPHLGRIPGVIPMSRNNELDRAISFVQQRLAKSMAVCLRKRCTRKYYFRTRKSQKYCSALCAEKVNRAGKLRRYHESPNSRKSRTSA